MKFATKIMTGLTFVFALFGGILLGVYASPDITLSIIIAAISFVALVFTTGYILGRKISHRRKQNNK